MTRDEVRQLEEQIAHIVRRLRAEHAAELGLLRERLDVLERAWAHESRLRALEARLADADHAGPTFSLPHLRAIK